MYQNGFQKWGGERRGDYIKEVGGKEGKFFRGEGPYWYKDSWGGVNERKLGKIWGKRERNG